MQEENEVLMVLQVVVQVVVQEEVRVKVWVKKAMRLSIYLLLRLRSDKEVEAVGMQ